MDEKTTVISSNLQTQWQDHFHMRDQTWKVLQYSILFFLGVVGLEIKQVDTFYLVIAYAALFLTSAFGVIIHRSSKDSEGILWMVWNGGKQQKKNKQSSPR